MPDRAGSSLRDPTPIQNPSAIDRTPSMGSVTTRSPLSSVAIWKPWMAFPFRGLVPSSDYVVAAQPGVTTFHG